MNNNNTSTNKKGNKGRSTLPLFISFVYVIIIGFCFMKDFEESKTDQSNSPKCSDTDKIYAYNCAINFVKKELKSPSSAIFPNSQQKVYDTQCSSDNTYKIVSSVESTNSFGAMITTNFSCTISFNEDKVRCEDLIFY